MATPCLSARTDAAAGAALGIVPPTMTSDQETGVSPRRRSEGCGDGSWRWEGFSRNGCRWDNEGLLAQVVSILISDHVLINKAHSPSYHTPHSSVKKHPVPFPSPASSPHYRQCWSSAVPGGVAGGSWHPDWSGEVSSKACLPAKESRAGEGGQLGTSSCPALACESS